VGGRIQVKHHAEHVWFRDLDGLTLLALKDIEGSDQKQHLSHKSVFLQPQQVPHFRLSGNAAKPGKARQHTQILK
jgi:hypothetical protein